MLRSEARHHYTRAPRSRRHRRRGRLTWRSACTTSSSSRGSPSSVNLPKSARGGSCAHARGVVGGGLGAVPTRNPPPPPCLRTHLPRLRQRQHHGAGLASHVGAVPKQEAGRWGLRHCGWLAAKPPPPRPARVCGALPPLVELCPPAAARVCCDMGARGCWQLAQCPDSWRRAGPPRSMPAWTPPLTVRRP